MIKVNIKTVNDKIESIKISGHAMYDVHGKDIVCASVSSIAITSINLALKLNDKSLDVVQKEGLIDAKVLVNDEIINTVLLNMKDMLEELSKDYERYVKII